MLLPGAHAVQALAGAPAARDFVSDAFAHCTFVGYAAPAATLFDAFGLGTKLDAGFVRLDDGGSVHGFLRQRAQLRFWERELTFG